VTLTNARERLQALPFANLVGRPTAVERLERFEKAIGSPYAIFIKRDDAIPFGFGGNKVRKLELVMAQALAEEATAVITCGGVQSNHCRATAAAAARSGVACHLVLSGERPTILTGNTRLDELFGAELHFVPGRLDRSPRMAELETDLRGRGEKPFVIPLGASTPLGAAGFARAVFELLEQGQRPQVIFHASSSGGTQAGLLAGAVLGDLEARIVGVSADEPAPALTHTVLGLQEGVFELIGANARARSPEVQDQFVGEGYGRPTDASHEALALLARSEAIVVDHTYTAKALAGLIAFVRQSSLRAGGSVLFWHTGGQVGALA
jgi:1-aminocyclopropane-1-carboxylate deaminase/D-cysteine desulfhydrase-like pyridoxal-dependent ACC family enzyme